AEDGIRHFHVTGVQTCALPISHIDLLRPRGEWNPPYDIVEPASPKAKTIRAAMEAVAEDLAVPVERVTPVCLASGQQYNVNDARPEERRVGKERRRRTQSEQVK